MLAQSNYNKCGSTFHARRVPAPLHRPQCFISRTNYVRCRAAPAGGEQEGVGSSSPPDVPSTGTPLPADPAPNSSAGAMKPPLDPSLPGAPLIDQGSPAASPEPPGVVKKRRPLPDGLSCWLAEQPNSDVQATLTGIRKDFIKQFSQHGTTTTTTTTGAGKDVTAQQELQQAVLREAGKYGEMVQAVYDTLLTKDVYSQYFGNCVPGVIVEGQKLSEAEPYTQLGDEAKKYKVLKRIEADSGGYKLVVKKARNYVGFIAESEPDADEAVDIAVVFRGTITKDEWVQDAKALKVRWRGGEQALSPPQIFLSSSPFKGNLQRALTTAIGTFVLLSSHMGTQAVNWVLGGLAALASHLGLGPVAGGLAGMFGWAVAALQHGVIDHLGIDGKEVNPELLSTAGVVGISVFLVTGIISAILDKPEEWGSNVGKLLKSLVPWMAFGIYTLLDGLFGLPWCDPRVSYGFKEMYCDALPYKSEGDKLSMGVVADSPRLTVYKTLVEVLNRKEGRKVKSITITGHSLGAALASMCGFDLATAIQEARTGTSAALPGSRYLSDEIMDKLKTNLPDRMGKVLSDFADKVAGLNPINEMYREVRDQRAAFVAAIKAIRPDEEPVPAVAVVSFAGPRVGDNNYSKVLGNRSIMCPMGVLEPLGSPSYRTGVWNNIQGFVRDWFMQTIKMPWFIVAKIQVAWEDLLWRLQPEKRKQAEDDAAAGVKVGMLRLVNAHDVVPNAPITLPLPMFFYVHGGYELLLNSYLVPYFKNGLLGQSIGARHNMEMYLHMLDHQRDRVLVNKSDDVLTDDQKIPESWWDPVPHKGLSKDKDGKWVRPLEDDSDTKQCP